MRSLCRTLLLAATVATLGCNHLPMAPPPATQTAAAVLQSPWDATPVTLSAQPYECGPPLDIAPDITVTNNLGGKAAHVSDPVKDAL